MNEVLKSCFSYSFNRIFNLKKRLKIINRIKNNTWNRKKNSEKKLHIFNVNNNDKMIFFWISYQIINIYLKCEYFQFVSL